MCCSTPSNWAPSIVPMRIASSALSAVASRRVTFCNSDPTFMHSHMLRELLEIAPSDPRSTRSALRWSPAFQKNPGGMIGRIRHEMHSQPERPRRLRPLVQEAVHIHHRRGTTLERLHIAHQAAEIGIRLGQRAVLALVLRQPIWVKAR